MKWSLVSAGFLCAVLLVGCARDDQVTGLDRQFDGITERDEWGDTLSVDSTDWVVHGWIPPAGFEAKPLPYFRDGIRLAGRTVQSDDNDYVIGAFPNPFIPGTGRLLIELVIPVQSSVRIHVEDESGDMNRALFEGDLIGVGVISWDGSNPNGNILPNGIYRIFFEAGTVSSFGDVQIQQALQPDPAPTTDYVVYAGDHFDYEEYLEFEFSRAAEYGADGELGGSDVFTLPITTWELMAYPDRFLYLPVFMNYDLPLADPFQYHYLLAYKHFQFGAGWPDDGDIGITDTTEAQWQKTNWYHNTYVDMYESGP